MNRRINNVQLQAAGGSSTPDTYFDKVVKYIPGDIVAAWVAVSGLVKASSDVPKDTVMWVSFAIGILLTAAWTEKQTRLPGKPAAIRQIAVSTVAFVVWVFALGSPFDSLAWYHSLYASLLLILYTLVVGLFD